MKQNIAVFFKYKMNISGSVEILTSTRRHYINITVMITNSIGVKPIINFFKVFY